MTTPTLRLVELARLDRRERSALVRRRAVPDPAIRRAVGEICDSVREGGDAAVVDAGRRFGGGRSSGLVVTAAELEAARAAAPARLIQATERAISNVAAFHRAQRPVSTTTETEPGVQIRRVWQPLRRVGAYVPGGKGAYPSSMIMSVIPARVAGVPEVVVASPAGPDGSLQPAFLVAAAMLEIDELYVVGGAQAVAALAYGTETIVPVDKIVGPGNAWVTAAKLAVLGDCAIDLPAGPSEVLVVADRTADPRLVAIDLLCQAEHGPDSPAVLVTTDPTLPDRVERLLAGLLPQLERRDVLRKALADHGLAVIAPDHSSALDFANEYAAEHVSILTADPESDAESIFGAGSVYVGRWSPESAGDYATGANHVLPTGGLARAAGPLSVEDFGSWRQVQTLTQAGLERLLPTICTLADAEGFTAHRMAAEMRFAELDR
jgi:histidinol dehydrogenase